MSERPEQDVRVDAFAAADEPAVLTLLIEAFDGWPHGADVQPGAFFRWKHETSPFGPSTRLVAKVDGEVAGFLALMPWPLRFAGVIHRSMRGVDLAVAPRFQRLGVATALIAASRRSYSDEVALAWSDPNERSRHGVLKAGRKRVDGLPRFLGPGGAHLGTLGRLVGAERPSPGFAADASLGAVLGDGALLERVLSGPGPPGRIATAHDVDFLRWRYGQRGDCRAVVGGHPRAGAGIAIFRPAIRGRLTVSRVCEIFTERDDERVVRDLLRRVRRSARTDLLMCALASSRTAARCGLLRSPRTTLVAANPLREGLVPDPTRASAWALSLGDLEGV